MENTMKIITFYLVSINQDQLLEYLCSQGVDIVIDVRYTTWMPMYYRPEPIGELLSSKQIEYHHYKDLGNPTNFRKKVIEESKIIEFQGNEISTFLYQKAKRVRNGKDVSNFNSVNKNEWLEDINTFKKETGKKPFWRKKETKALKEWKFWNTIDIKKMDSLAKKYYLSYINENKQKYLINLSTFIQDNPDKTFCLICSCATLDSAKCHRFWLLDRIKELLIETKNN
jgi:hypothetical protein